MENTKNGFELWITYCIEYYETYELRDISFHLIRSIKKIDKKKTENVGFFSILLPLLLQIVALYPPAISPVGLALIHFLGFPFLVMIFSMFLVRSFVAL